MKQKSKCAHISKIGIYHSTADDIYRIEHIVPFLESEALSLFPELERLHLQRMNLEDELLSLHKQEKALREKVSALEELEDKRNEELASKMVASLLNEEPESAPSTLPKVSLEWCASPEKVRSLYASQTKALWR